MGTESTQHRSGTTGTFDSQGLKLYEFVTLAYFGMGRKILRNVL